MSTEFTRTSLRLAAAAVLAGGLAACSTMQSIDPTGLLGDDGSSASSDTGGLSDAGAGAADDTAQPDVASIPDRPEAPSSADENAQVANSLQADAANVQYSAESLRGGTEASAPPPPASAGAPAPGATDTTTPANTQVAEATPAQPPAAPPPPDTSADVATADVPAGNITPGTTNTAGPLTEAPAQPAAAPPPTEPAPGDVASVPDETVAAPVSDDTATQTAAADTAPPTEAPSQPAAAPAPETSAPADTAAAPEAAPEPSADTAVASAPAQPAPAATPDAAPAPAPTQVASAAPVPGAQAPVTRRAAPGFAPSNAPPLDPSVSQFVAAPVVARYKQTAMLKPSVYPDYTSTPGYFGPATAIVVFPGDTTILDDKGLQQVRAAAELFKSHGGQGYVRIVGYASATSGNLSDARLMHINFDHSQARATAIARALMKEGVPAKKVLVDAAPQTASVAKAEIFVQG
jgi:outer membrane protein OmpA-like peptidoglycan-associated protein